MPQSRWFRATVALVAFAALLACGSGGSERPDPAPNPGGGIGAPVGQPNTKEALGSPINIPKITNSQGEFVNVVRPKLEQELRKLCGNGELCVTLRVRPGDNDILTVCRFDTTDPPPGMKVERHTTVYIVTGVKQPCDQPS